MGVDFGLSETAMIGMAVAAAGAAANTAAQMKRSREIEKVNKNASQLTEERRKEALGAWEQGLSQLTPEQQRAAIDAESNKRMAAYTAAAGDTPPELNIIKTTDTSPAIVKTEAAKQLGTKLDMARAQMAGQAKMAGWDANTFNENLGLNRTGEKVGMLGDFIQGNQHAAGIDSARWNAAQPAVPLGDILEGAGSMMMGASGGGTKSLPAMRPQDVQWANWYNQIG